MSRWQYVSGHPPCLRSQAGTGIAAQINIRILPFDAPADLVRAHNSVTLLTMPPGHGDDLVYIESSNVGGTYLSDKDSVMLHRQRLTALFLGAAGKDATVEIIDSHIKRLANKR
ncbi:Scr1 family TA system antitoxin-like transcriptional regulator [Streptomyces sp. NPDC092903]|uniref:Scr1 family TA system antitoxin-like transcriptional regulator n=1 Tax=Streptomyces sp. NPDC092903 TaxID=3366017 RepID=UPI00380A1242